jgi:hypothetical protein
MVDVVGERGVGVVEEGTSFHNCSLAIGVSVFVYCATLVETRATSRKEAKLAIRIKASVLDQSSQEVILSSDPERQGQRTDIAPEVFESSGER